MNKLPVGAKHGLSFMDLKYDLYSEFVNAVVCEMCCTGLGYNGTQLYIAHQYFDA